MFKQNHENYQCLIQFTKLTRFLEISFPYIKKKKELHSNISQFAKKSEFAFRIGHIKIHCIVENIEKNSHSLFKYF